MSGGGGRTAETPQGVLISGGSHQGERDYVYRFYAATRTQRVQWSDDTSWGAAAPVHLRPSRARLAAPLHGRSRVIALFVVRSRNARLGRERSAGAAGS